MTEAKRPEFRQLLQSLSQDLRLLLGQTVRLGRAEVNAAMRSTILSVAVVVSGIVVAIGGVLVLLSALVLIAIALGLPPWAAATLVAFVLIGAGAGVAYLGVVWLRRVEFNLQQTRRNIRETLAWLKAQATP